MESSCRSATAVEIGKDGGEELGRLVGVDHIARLGEERGGADVGRQRLAVAVDDVGASLRGGADEASAVLLVAVRADAEQDQPARKHGVEDEEAEHRQHHAGAAATFGIAGGLHFRSALVPPNRGGDDRRHCAASFGSSVGCFENGGERLGIVWRGAGRPHRQVLDLGDLHRVERLQLQELLVTLHQLLHARRLDEQAPFGCQKRLGFVLLIELALKLDRLFGDGFGPVLDLKHEDRSARRCHHRKRLQPTDH